VKSSSHKITRLFIKIIFAQDTLVYYTLLLFLACLFILAVSEGCLAAWRLRPDDRKALRRSNAARGQRKLLINATNEVHRSLWSMLLTELVIKSETMQRFGYVTELIFRSLKQLRPCPRLLHPCKVSASPFM
jgi:hypothetical protein